MKTKNKILILILLMSILLINGCSDATSKEQEYQKCTSVCAAIVESPELEEGYVLLELCRQECKKQFLE